MYMYQIVLFVAQKYYHDLLIHPSVDKYLGCLQFSTTINKIAVTVLRQVFLWVYALISLESVHRSGSSDS